jgi:peptidoglycan-N-acetylglucosamine deacetylase
MQIQSSLTPSAAPRWRAPLLVRASVGLHAGALLGVAAFPSLWPWALGMIVMNQALLTAVGLWPRSAWLGDNMRRLPASAIARREIAITIDDGPDPDVTSAVLDVLAAHGAKATFFCIAERADRHPQLCRRIVEHGHSVQNHSRRHALHFAFLGTAGFSREISEAQQGLTRITGQTPRFFRAPAGLRNPLLAPVLHRLGLRLVSWTRRGYDTVQRDPARVLDRLTRSLAAGDIVLLHDGNAARTADGRPVVLEVLPQLLRRCEQAGLRPVTLPEALRTDASSAPADADR